MHVLTAHHRIQAVLVQAGGNSLCFADRVFCIAARVLSGFVSIPSYHVGTVVPGDPCRTTSFVTCCVCSRYPQACTCAAPSGPRVSVGPWGSRTPWTGSAAPIIRLSASTHTTSVCQWCASVHNVPCPLLASVCWSGAFVPSCTILPFRCSTVAHSVSFGGSAVRFVFPSVVPPDPGQQHL